MRKATIAVVLAVLLVDVLFVAVDAQTTYQVFENIRARTLTTLGNLTVGADLLVTGDVTADGITAATLNATGNSTLEDVVVSGYIAGQGELIMIPAAAITVTDGGTITPTTAVVKLTAAGAVGADLAACDDGQITILINTANQTITISDTGTTRLAGNAALGQYDTLTVVGQGISCNEVARANN